MQSKASNKHPILGVWLIEASEAPFSQHMFAFLADGVLLQSNPEAGNPEKSDSMGMGVWEPVKNSAAVRAKFVEVSASRQNHKFVSRGEVTFELTVNGNNLSGHTQANFYNAAGKLLKGPLHSPVEGRRIHLD